MKAIHFETTVGADQVIRPPSGITLPEGAIEVTVRPLIEDASDVGDTVQSTRQWLLALAAEAERVAPDLPSDLAEHHDHYAHGTPLP